MPQRLRDRGERRIDMARKPEDIETSLRRVAAVLDPLVNALKVALNSTAIAVETSAAAKPGFC